jgi:PAS domain S-box-containing protein
MSNRAIRWFKNISIAKKLYLVVGTMALLIAVELFTLWFSLNTLSSVRAFVAGEGLWSKSQKDAVYYLQKYSRTYSEKDYLRFQEFMKVPLGDHKTLLELRKANPDFKLAYQGFIEGRNHPNDIDGMIKLFRRFHRIYYINKAIIIWSKADSAMNELIPIGKRLHEEITSELPSEERVDEIISDIDPINQRLTMLEDDFSYTLGDGARWLEGIILKILFLIALTVELTGLFLTISVSVGITRGLNEVINTASKVAKADFSKKAKIYSNDEIGQLASSFNKMIDDLRDNINERTQIEQELRKQKDLYESLIETQSEMGQGIAITEDKSIIYANDALCKMYGYSKDEIIGMPSFIDIVVPEDRERLVERLEQRLLGQGFIGDTGETAVICKDGKVIQIEYSIKMIETEGRVQSLSVIRDITYRKQKEEELKQKTLELTRSNNELEQFAYIASHDLKEPLRMVTSYVQLLEDRYGDKLDKDAKEFIAYAVEGTERMRNLIHSLLEYSRTNRVKPFESFNVTILLNSVLQNIYSLIEENNAVIKAEILPTIYGDSQLIGQLFQNLIANAIKFKSDEDPEIIISCRKMKDEYLFSMEDNGIGIEKEYADKIFVIFQRLHTKDKYPGTGIGLAICKKIVEHHGGRIWVESKPEKGSIFYFTINKI